MSAPWPANPIHKKRSARYKPQVGGMVRITLGYWYAICPDCGDTLKALGVDSSRKKAKDMLYNHRKRRCQI